MMRAIREVLRQRLYPITSQLVEDMGDAESAKDQLNLAQAFTELVGELFGLCLQLAAKLEIADHHVWQSFLYGASQATGGVIAVPNPRTLGAEPVSAPPPGSFLN